MSKMHFHELDEQHLVPFGFSERADYYYVSFRILNNFDLYTPSLYCISYSVELYLKLLLVLKDFGGNWNQAKDCMRRHGHNIKSLLLAVGLTESEFPTLFMISTLNSQSVRYGARVYPNGLNTHMNDLNEELLGLKKIIAQFNGTPENQNLTDFKKPNINNQGCKEELDRHLRRISSTFNLGHYN